MKPFSKKRFVFALFVLLTAFLSGKGSGLTSILQSDGRHTTLSAADTGSGHFDPDTESDALNYSQLANKLGPVPKAVKHYRVGAVMKFFGNHYWQLLAMGMQSKADELDIELDMRAASTESDPLGQSALMEAMVEKKYDALLISPQTDGNLIQLVEKAQKSGILILNVNDAVVENAEHWVGPNQYENGVRAAKYFMERIPEGGKIAVIKGLEGVYAVRQRTRGFIETLKGTRFDIVAEEEANWDLQKALEIASNLIKRYPDLRGFYCNNDAMALGVIEAVKNADKLGKMIVIGTDGISPAYDSIRSGEMAATVDSFPFLTGQIAVEVALRLLEGQDVPRAVYSPQNLITVNNVDKPLPQYAEDK